MPERKFTLLNAYIATVRSCNDDTRRDEFNPVHLPKGRDVIIAADANAHHELGRKSSKGCKEKKIVKWMDQMNPAMV